MATEAKPSKDERAASVVLAILMSPLHHDGQIQPTATIHDMPTAKKILALALNTARQEGRRSALVGQWSRN